MSPRPHLWAWRTASRLLLGVLLLPLAATAEAPMDRLAELREERSSVGKEYDWRYAEDLQAFAERIQDSLVRLERHAEKESELEAERVIDGVGLVVGPRRVVTPSRWLEGARSIWAIQDDQRLGEAVVVAREERLGLLLLELKLPRGKMLQPVEGFAQLEDKLPTELVLPNAPGRSTAGVNRGVAIREGEVVYVGGVLRNGVPGFDSRARALVICYGPTPDQGRSVAFDGAAVGAFVRANLEAAVPEPAPKKTDPAP
ncbi:MAG: hypothetical protein P1V51_10295 [Deltaproteobacteria bacterium]|nr:hypothetical protein [Deltaproteobacteria bacterium]